MAEHCPDHEYGEVLIAAKGTFDDDLWDPSEIWWGKRQPTPVNIEITVDPNVPYSVFLQWRWYYPQWGSYGSVYTGSYSNVYEPISLPQGSSYLPPTPYRPARYYKWFSFNRRQYSPSNPVSSSILGGGQAVDRTTYPTLEVMSFQKSPGYPPYIVDIKNRSGGEYTKIYMQEPEVRVECSGCPRGFCLCRCMDAEKGYICIPREEIERWQRVALNLRRQVNDILR